MSSTSEKHCSNSFPAKILEQNVAKIEKIRELFGAPSFAIGIVHRGERAFRGFGFANQTTGRTPDEGTVYGLGSCTKALTGTSLALLASVGKIDLDASVSKRLPELKTVNSPVVSERMTVRDMTSHCVGLNQLLYEVVGRYGHVFTRHDDVVNIFNHLPKVAEFKSEWKYDNWLFALAGVLINRVSGMSFGRFVQNEIFDKLGMSRSYFHNSPDENYAVPYRILDDNTPLAADLPTFQNGDAFDSSGSLRSCVKDILTWAEALMDASHSSNSKSSRLGWISQCFGFASHKSRSGAPKRLQNAMKTIQTPHFPLGEDLRQQYAMGLYHYELPTPQINVVTNDDVNKSPYVLGSADKRRVMVGHTGEYGGYLSVYWTFPEEDAAIVVLCNCYDTNGDPTNIVAQLLAQELLDMNPRVDMVEVAEALVENTKSRWTTALDGWTSNREYGTEPGPIESYVGSYRNADLSMWFEISIPSDAKEQTLVMKVNGVPEQTFPLYHYHKDSWTFFPASKNECIANGYSSYMTNWRSFIVNFSALDDGAFGEVSWELDHDRRVDAQVFKRAV